MVEIKTEYIHGWVKEAAGSVNKPSADAGNGAFTALGAGDTAYQFGERVEGLEALLVSQKSIRQPHYLYNSGAVNVRGRSKYELGLLAQFNLMDGIPLFFALGQSADGDDGGIKTHAITLRTPQQVPESLTVHYEAEDVDGTSDIYRDFMGCRVNRLTLSGRKYESIKCEMELFGQDKITSVELNTPPVLKPTAKAGCFHFGQLTPVYSGITIDQILTWNLTINLNVNREGVDHATTFYRAKYLLLKDPVVTFNMSVLLKNNILGDEVKTQTDRTASFTLQRTDADDKIIISLTGVTAASFPWKVPALYDRPITIFSGRANGISAAVRDAIADY